MHLRCRVIRHVTARGTASDPSIALHHHVCFQRPAEHLARVQLCVRYICMVYRLPIFVFKACSSRQQVDPDLADSDAQRRSNCGGKEHTKRCGSAHCYAVRIEACFLQLLVQLSYEGFAAHRLIFLLGHLH